MGKAFTIHKNKTVPVIPHVNYMYGVSNKRFNRVITTTRMPDYFTYLGGTHTANSRAHCAFCVFDGILYTTFGRTSGDSSTNTLHADRLGDGMVTNDSSEMAESPVALALSDCSGLVIKDSKPYFINYKL
jgi:predicted class III extradiol MEMO1 family dioxygenase